MVVNFMQSPQNCGLSIGVCIKGKSTFFNYGEVKRDSKKIPDSLSIYEIGSITKTFTGLLHAQSFCENKLKPEEDIRKYLPGKYPELNYYGKVIRVIHLANHSSGLPRIPQNMTTQLNFEKDDPYKNYTKEMLLNYLHTVKLLNEPGKEFEYSPLGMAVLGIILDNVNRTSFENLLNEKIFIPYHLENTAITLNTEQNLRMTTGYGLDSFEAIPWEMGVFAPAGAIKSCTKDMLNYLEINRREGEKALTLAHLPSFTNKENVALAWFIKKTKQGNDLIWHNGATFGYGSFCGFIKSKECSLVILSNSATNVDFLGIAILNYLQK